jgi:four helix bundle protein
MKEFSSQVFKDSVNLSQTILRMVGAMDNTLKFTIGQQMIRSSVSIPSNISEGFGRNSDAQILNFLNIAHGSCCELISQIMIIDGMIIGDSTFVAEELMKDTLSIKDQLRRLCVHYKK